MTEPQLSAEMEKRFDEELKHNLWSDADSLAIDMSGEVKHFLATALEEQREKYIEQVEKMKLEMLPNLEGADGKYVEENNRIIEDVLAILNGKE